MLYHSKTTSQGGKVIHESPSTLSPEQKALLETAPNYDAIRTFLKKVHTEVDIYVSTAFFWLIWPSGTHSICNWTVASSSSVYIDSGHIIDGNNFICGMYIGTLPA